MCMCLMLAKLFALSCVPNSLFYSFVAALDLHWVMNSATVFGSLCVFVLQQGWVLLLVAGEIVVLLLCIVLLLLRMESSSNS
ncbi:unnamed protein product, partial [Sphagnum compactum]